MLTRATSDAHSFSHAVTTNAAHVDWSAAAQFVSGLGLVAVTLVGALYARHQAVTARTRVVLDLYEKRWPIYEATLDLLASILRNGAASVEEVQRFRLRTNQAHFLFGTDLLDYLQEVQEHTFALRVAQSRGERMTDSDYEKQDRELTWLFDQLKELDEKFSPYMGLRLAARAVRRGS